VNSDYGEERENETKKAGLLTPYRSTECVDICRYHDRPFKRPNMFRSMSLGVAGAIRLLRLMGFE
jgi:hypothetical protein